jgi:DNA polymerase-3 subunit epsilon/oligoribonuclease
MKIVFIDIETTGLDFSVHVPIDIAICIVDYSNKDKKTSYSSCITCDASDWDRADVEALAVNGFNPKSLWNGKRISEVHEEVKQFLRENNIIKGKAVFMCQNPSFDRAFFHKIISSDKMNDLDMPYHWLDLASMYWIKFYGIISEVNAEYFSLSKDSIAKTFGIPPEEKPHRAMNGVKHLIQCYNALRTSNDILQYM